MHSKQVKIMSDRLNIFIYKYAYAKMSVSRQKKIQGLFKKDVFNIVTLDRVVIPDKIPENIQVFNFYFVDNIKDLCTDKANKKSWLFINANNDKKKNFMLMHSSKISEVSHSNGFYLDAII